MRECPKCGFKDLPIWRNNPHALYQQYCHIEELEVWDKQLAELIRKKRDIKIQGYIYHLTKSGHVKRLFEDFSKDGKSWHEAETEKSKAHFFVKGQTKLRVEEQRNKP